MPDARAAAARDRHRLAREAEATARRCRSQRDHLIRLLRAEDPRRWTYAVLADEVGCSPELIAVIARGRPPEAGAAPSPATVRSERNSDSGTSDTAGGADGTTGSPR